MLRRPTALLLAAMVLPGAARAQSISDVFRRVQHAVVVVYTTQTDYTMVSPTMPVQVGGLGSGVVISDTDIMTAAHVVEAADEVWVEFTTGDTIPATVVSSDQSNDVALLRLGRSAPIQAAPLGNSDEVQVGDQVFVVGAPLGQAHTLTVGHVSARRESNNLFGGVSRVELLQTDAAINPGNSGGPMFNLGGEVVGIVSHIISQTGGFEGLGYAVTTNVARDILFDPGAKWWGMELVVLQGPLAQLLNVPPPHTAALVQRVAQESPAQALGLRPGVVQANIGGRELLLGGDLIMAVNGIPLGDNFQNLDQIQESIRQTMPGQAMTVSILRGGKQMVLRGRPPG